MKRKFTAYLLLIVLMVSLLAPITVSAEPVDEPVVEPDMEAELVVEPEVIPETEIETDIVSEQEPEILPETEAETKLETQVTTGVGRSVLTKSQAAVLVMLGIASDVPDSDVMMTRGEAAYYLANAGKEYYFVNEGSERQYYADVAADHRYSDAINRLYEWGVMTGYSDRTFRPDEGISRTELMVAALRLAGYGRLAEMYGGYPGGYLKFGVKLLEGVSRAEGAITSAEGLKIVYNLLFLEMPVLELVSDRIDTTIRISDKSFIEEVFSVDKKYGMPVANEKIGVRGNVRTDDGYVSMKDNSGNIRLYKSSNDMSTYMGVSSEYYVREDEVLCIIPKPKTAKLTVDNVDFGDINPTLTRFSYQTEGNRDRIIKVDQDADYIYNGTSSYNVSRDNFKVNEGYAEFVDVDGDDTYDIVWVWNYEAYLVSAVSPTAFKITDKITGKTIELDADNDDYYLSIRMFGTDAVFSFIEEYSVVSIAESNEDTGKKLITAEISNNVVEGTVTGKDGDNRYIEIDGEEYEVANNFDASAVELRAVGMFGIDFRGKLACAYLGSTSGANYGYLLGAKHENFQMYAKVRFMNTQSEIVVADTSNKFYLNDVRCEPENLATMLDDGGGKVKKQLISYTMDKEGKIKRIYTATGADEGIVDTDGVYRLVHNKKYSGDIKFLAPQGTVDGTYFIKTTMPVFKLVVDDSGRVIEEKSGVMTYNSVTTQSGLRLNVDLYDSNKRHEPAVGLMTLKESELSSLEAIGRNVMVVSAIIYGVNADGDFVTYIEGFEAGKSVCYEVAEAIEDSFVEGDIVFLYKNKDIVVDYKPVFTPHCTDLSDTTKLYGDVSYTASAEIDDKYDLGYGKSGRSICFLGTINEIFSDGLVATVLGSGEKRRYQISSSTMAYQMNAKGGYRVLALDEVVSDGRKCLVTTRYGAVMDIVVLEE